MQTCIKQAQIKKNNTITNLGKILLTFKENILFALTIESVILCKMNQNCSRMLQAQYIYCRQFCHFSKGFKDMGP
jgi:hypothetical protein